MEHRTELDSMAFICGDRAGKCTLEKQLRDSLSDAYITSSVPHMVEIGHKNAGKGNTLLYLMRLLGISPDEAIEMCIRDRVWTSTLACGCGNNFVYNVFVFINNVSDSCLQDSGYAGTMCASVCTCGVGISVHRWKCRFGRSWRTEMGSKSSGRRYKSTAWGMDLSLIHI